MLGGQIVGLLALTGLACAAWTPTTKHEYQAELGNEDKLWLFWDLNRKAKTITFEVHAQTQGFWGIGFSWNGGMPYSDIVVGWIDANGKPWLSDRNVGAVPGKPQADLQQDYHLIGAQNNGTHFFMAFTRKWDTCDAQDFVISQDTMRAMWTINDYKPQNSDDIVKHAPHNRGNRAIYFFDLHDAGAPPTGNDVNTFDVRSNNAQLPANYHSLFWCHVIKRPDTGKVHMIRYEPIIQKGHEPYVHHMVLFQCTGDMEKYVGKEEACWDPKDNPDHFSGMVVCTQIFLAAWAVGDNAHIYPDNVGYPLFEAGSSTYYMLQTHYDNSAYAKNITDSSGLRIYYTSKLRKYEAALFTTGTITMEATPTVPPNMPTFTNYGLCPSSCTNRLPKEGINVFSGFLHMHLIGRVQKVRLFRKGVEQPPLFDDNNWDFAYQQVRMLSVPRQILPGDEIQTECTMTTTGRNFVTTGGQTTRNEMCFAFMEYWPRPKDYVEICISSYNYYNAITKFMGAKNVTMNPLTGNQVQVQTQDNKWEKYVDWVAALPWTEYDPENGKMMRDNFQTFLASDSQFGMCIVQNTTAAGGGIQQPSGLDQLPKELEGAKRHLERKFGLDHQPNKSQLDVVPVIQNHFFTLQGIFTKNPNYKQYTPKPRCMAVGGKSSTAKTPSTTGGASPLTSPLTSLFSLLLLTTLALRLAMHI